MGTSHAPASLGSLPAAIGDWPRTRATVAAVEFIEAHEPTYLVNHSIRSYFYAVRLAGLAGLSKSDYDDEILFLAAVLHDVGLTEVANGTQRFEVDGADAAAEFVMRHGLPKAAAEVVWDAVAFHTTAGIPHRKRPEIAYTHFGTFADIFEFGAEELHDIFRDDVFLAAVHDRYPRLDVRTCLTRAVADQIRARPAKFVPWSFPAAAVHLAYPEMPVPDPGAIVASRRWAE
ncbi:HD domain-containing protein [Streptomyces sp. 8K308]|uniref:HD domain-containing protein n=1 Tax=Streptomyces sp. 8K308 TaxID=2530388 RepID=UPI001049427F|nr:HD domain-containing protein [Streptomyces sp. 8K308]TDC13428.1 HD domain-containing protein [Streptomyces sp. 8K308]